MAISYTLGDLIRDPRLNLELLTGSDAALTTPLQGAHSIELDRPSEWLDPGWLMLTMGVRLRQRPSEQRRLIQELQELGATALGFGVGVAFKSVPPALLEEAEARDFPVVRVPAATQFHEISRLVFQSTVSNEAQTYARLTSLQQNLMRAFSDPDPLDSTLRRIGRFVNSTVAVISADGTVHAATGSLPVRAIAEHLGERPTWINPVEIGEWRVVVAPLGSEQPTGMDRTLVVASRSWSTPQPVVRMMLDAAVPMLEALGSYTAASRERDQALSKAMLENALAKPLADIEAGQLVEHLTAAGVESSSGYCCVVLRSDDQSLVDEAEMVLDASRRRLAGIHSRRPHEIVVVVGAADSTMDMLRATVGSSLFDRLRTGVGRAVPSVRALAGSYRDAAVVLRYLELEGAGSAFAFEDLDLASQLLAEVPPERIAPKVKQIADLLQNSPIQLEALRAYFAACQDVQAAAKSIFVHPNTLRYRLERFEEAMGRSLRDPASIASLHYVLASVPALDAQSRPDSTALVDVS